MTPVVAAGPFGIPSTSEGFALHEADGSSEVFAGFANGLSNTRGGVSCAVQGRGGGVPKVVVVADDNQFIRTLVIAALKPLGCEIIEAADGEEAVRLIGARTPDLVLLDLVMPKLSGFEVLEIIRQEEATARTPVVMLTTAASESDYSEGKRHGATDYVVKPFNNTELRATVAELLGI
jgi:CheY-like chemotaxis protein